MWVFTRYGFVSVAWARQEGGDFDPDAVMLRARSKRHLENPKERFADSPLGEAEIRESHVNDYRYRVIIPKSAWASIPSELAMEQTWSNFKNESARFAKARKESSAYVNALHRIWEVMYELQEKWIRKI